MSYPHVRLHLADNTAVAWNDDHSRLKTADLEYLLQQCRHSVTSLETELTRRNIRTYSISTKKVDTYFDLLQRFVLQVDLTGRLDDKAVDNVSTATRILKTSTTDRKTEIYQRFVYDILRLHGRELFLACVGCLGKHKMANMNDDDRLDLLDRLRRKGQQLKLDVLIHLAIKNHIPSFDEPQLAHLAHLHGKRTWDEGPGSDASDVAKTTSNSQYQIAQTTPFTLPTGHSTWALLPLGEAGAEVILKVTREDKNALNITLPAPHESLPFMLIPHQICANIMRKYTDRKITT